MPKKITTKRGTRASSASDEAGSRPKSCKLLLCAVLISSLIGIFTRETEFSMEQVKVKGRMGITAAINLTLPADRHPVEQLPISATPSSDDTQQSDHNELPIPATLRERALEFVASRQKAYETNGIGKNWKMRGHGWLDTYQKVALAARIAPDEHKLTVGSNSVQIFNVHPKSDPTRNDCDLLSLWVRLDGPEILSGKPYAVQNDDGGACYWQYDFYIAIPGTYTIDSKMLMWNGKAPVKFYYSGNKPKETHFISPFVPNEQTQCKVVFPDTNQLPDQQLQQAPQKADWVGFKFYKPLQSCCEICRRTPGCQYWATPPKIMPLPTSAQNGCELYFGSSTPEDQIPTSSLIDHMVREQQSILDAKAAAQAAANAAAQAQAEAQAAANTAAEATAQQAQTLVQTAMQQPNNRRRRLDEGEFAEAWGIPHSDNSEVAYFIGCGWSFQFTLDFQCLSGDEDDLVFMERNQFEVVEEKPKQQLLPQPPLPLCTRYDESIVPNVTGAGVGRWVREPYPSDADCPPYEEIKGAYGFISKPTPTNPKCWHRSDMTHLNKQCREANCPLMKPTSNWQSAPLQQEDMFYAVWRNYHCDYYQYTNDELSHCFQAKGISHIRTEGASISQMFQEYLKVRMANVTLAPPGGKPMYLSSIRWPHMLWKMDNEEWLRELEAKSAVEESYWLSPMFTSSEREPYVTLDRGIQLLEMAQPILEAKGWHMINLFDATAAMTYDVSAQKDGLHIIGPPFKYAMDRIFHHMCSGVVAGVRA